MKSPDSSLKYRLRLIWAYKDLLRNHFPLVTKWYVRRFRQSQIAAAQRLQGKQRIEVALSNVEDLRQIEADILATYDFPCNEQLN